MTRALGSASVVLYNRNPCCRPQENMPANIIQYTGDQARNFAGISPEAWRHWRKVVPRLAAKSGKKARFSADELIALAVLTAAVSTLNVGISHFANRWDELFDLCTQQRPTSLRSVFVIVTAEKVELVDADRLGPEQPAIVIPCKPIVERLWAAAFFDVVEQAQVPLPFPPQAVGGTLR